MSQTTFRIASFNVENLFDRPKVFNFQDKSIGDELLRRIDGFRKILKKEVYTKEDKAALIAEYTLGDAAAGVPPLKDYIKVREDRGKLWSWRYRRIVGVAAGGQKEWDGTVEFVRAKFSETGRKNTGKVITGVKADVACIVEADNRPALKKFDTDVLRSRYPYEMLIDGNDLRGIDVALYSRFSIGRIFTHMFDGTSRSRTFSRDCPEYEIHLPNREKLYMLCNHLKSKGYDPGGTADERRKRQARAVVEILEKYDLGRDWVVVAGDFNDTPDSAPLKVLMDVPDLHDVLALKYPDAPGKRWTYHYRDFEQIDYILVSKPLKEKFIDAGVERRGMYNLKRLTEDEAGIDREIQYESVNHWTNAASDHGAVWADFRLDI